LLLLAFIVWPFYVIFTNFRRNRNKLSISVMGRKR